MAVSTVTIPFLGTRVSPRRNLSLHVPPYAIILICCFLCNLVPLIPVEEIQEFSSLDAGTVDILAYTGPEFWQDVS
jgi:hypothetical protein